MKQISVFDTSVTSYNLGNQIIMDAVIDILSDIFPGDYLFRLPWEGAISKAAHQYMSISDYVFFGGTNSLSSQMLNYKQMCFRKRDLINFDKLCLLGLGWWQYQTSPDMYTKIFLKRLLRDDFMHSVRDQYTKNMLATIGINNVVNTCCPTTWKLTPEHCSSVPTQQSSNVVLTLTDYSKSRDEDYKLLQLLLDSYTNVYYWLQGSGDFEYIMSFANIVDKIILIPPRLAEYDKLLDRLDCDYIGTRLHAGIRAIQRKKRALILAVDNRAVEISKDVHLNVKARSDVNGIVSFIRHSFVTKLNIPFHHIQRWKAQFD